MRPMQWLRLQVLLGALLLFSMEPMVGRLLLPHYGGAFYVWATTLMFFQGALFVGYLYAHAIEPRLGRWHLLVVVAPLVLLPFQALPDGPEGGMRLLIDLLKISALPFTVLASTSVVAQRWLANSQVQRSDPYRLYAASNAGSLLALLLYALVWEPWFGLHQQTLGWAAVYLLYVVCTVAAWFAAKPQRAARSAAGPGPAARQLVFWALLAAGPSALSMAVTNLLVVELGNVPLLWVLPLAAYLLTFMLAFGRIGTPAAFIRAVPHVAVMALAVYLTTRSGAGLVETIGSLLIVMFVLAWATHGVLFEQRPAAAHLSAYYLAMAAGGWLGGAFVAVAAPHLFNGLGEFVFAVLLILLTVVLARRPWGLSRQEGAALAAVVGAFALMFWGMTFFAGNDTVLAQRRSPYGAYRVISRSVGGQLQRLLTSGRTVHGRMLQSADGHTDPTPLSYYHAQGPLGDVMRSLAPSRRIGVVGLGVGAIKGHLQAGDAVVFYEIDPLVDALAHDYFGGLQTPAHAEVRLGDARRLLASEDALGAPRYHALIVDAFTGDGVPLHLLTVEALALYLRRVEPGGPVVLHVSNRYAALENVVAAGAARLGVRAVKRFKTSGLAPLEDASKYVAIGAVDRLGWEPISAGAVSAWTDDHASVLPLWLDRLLR